MLANTALYNDVELFLRRPWTCNYEHIELIPSKTLCELLGRVWLSVGARPDKAMAAEADYTANKRPQFKNVIAQYRSILFTARTPWRQSPTGLDGIFQVL